MSNIHLHSEYPCSDTCVPNQFIDKYMPSANGEFVKVYLYLLRALGSCDFSCSIANIADTFNHTEADIIRALKYWERMELLLIEYTDNKISGIQIKAMPEVHSQIEKNTDDVSLLQYIVDMETSDAASPVAKDAAPSSASSTDRRVLTLDDLKEFRQKDDVQELIFIAETYLRHTLSEVEMNNIYFWYEDLKFSSDLIVYLIEYCITKGHTSFRYMDKVARAWKDEGITSIADAKESAAIHSKAHYAIMKAFGISNRNLVDSEIALIDKWTKDFVFDLDIILEACKRTMNAIHQPSFEYTDTILSNWSKNHVHTLKDIENLDAAFSQRKKISVNTVESKPKKNKFTNFNQRDYDYDQLEKVLLNSTVQQLWGYSLEGYYGTIECSIRSNHARI